MKTAAAGILAAIIGAALMYWKGAQESALLRAEVERLTKLEAARSVEHGPATLPPEQTTAPAAVKPIEKIVTVKAPDDSATRQEMLRLLDEKNAKLSAADAAMRELRERLADLEAKLAQAIQEKDQLASAHKDLREQFDTATRVAESLREQSRAREARLARAEVSSEDLRKRGDEAARKLARLGELTTQMEDLAGRRDGYINSVLRRVREATELFRTLALRSDDPNLARIQQTITAADEDLRQLQTLNAQAARLQKDQALARK